MSEQEFTYTYVSWQYHGSVCKNWHQLLPWQ